MDKKLTERVRNIARALKRLEVDQGSLARRNARLATRRECYSLLREIDKLYPAPPRKVPKKRRKHAPVGEWDEREAPTKLHAKALYRAGIRVDGDMLAPAWAVRMIKRGVPPERIAKARWSVSERRAILAEIALGGTFGHNFGHMKLSEKLKKQMQGGT